MRRGGGGGTEGAGEGARRAPCRPGRAGGVGASGGVLGRCKSPSLWGGMVDGGWEWHMIKMKMMEMKMT